MKITKLLAASAVAVTLAMATGAAPASASSTKRAQTPSGNISCVARNYGDPGWSLTCSAEDPGTTMRISTAGHAYAAAYQTIARRGTVLRYGHSYNLGPFRCTSSAYGLDCSTVSRDASVVTGFWLSRENAYTY
ncbi:MAG TPA: hypothetical protein VI300_24930 [Solirubrobacter sp.]